MVSDILVPEAIFGGQIPAETLFVPMCSDGFSPSQISAQVTDMLRFRRGCSPGALG